MIIFRGGGARAFICAKNGKMVSSMESLGGGGGVSGRLARRRGNAQRGKPCVSEVVVVQVVVVVFCFFFFVGFNCHEEEI